MSDTPKIEGLRDYAMLDGERLLALWSALDALRAEVERLTECLKRSNDQAEEFERKWYLRGDEVERLRAALGCHIGEEPMHRYFGMCPDHLLGWDVRDPGCEACTLLDAALQEPTPFLGMKVVVDPKMPAGTIEMRSGNQTVSVTNLDVPQEPTP